MRGNFLWRAEDVVCAVRGRCLHEQSWIASGISIDSRATRPGDLFVALQGSSADGHDYVADAFAAGAAAALIMRQPLQAPPGARLDYLQDAGLVDHRLEVARVPHVLGREAQDEHVLLERQRLGGSHGVLVRLRCNRRRFRSRSRP